MATNAWWWWILTDDIELNCDSTFARIDQVMRSLVREAIERTAPGQPLRSAAITMAEERMEQAFGATITLA
jgi:glutamate dehydrogenase/leucine dehydrogenase